MSDNDIQDTSTDAAETVEFSSDPFSDTPAEPKDTPSEDTTTPAEPATDTAETTDTPEEAEAPATEEPAEPEQPDEATTEEQSNEVDLKSMSRAERAEYFKSLNQQQQRQIEEAIDQNYQPQPLDELKQQFTDQGYDEFQATLLARDEVREQRLRIAEAKAEISELNAALSTEAVEVVSTIDWLNSTNQQTFDKESADLASDLYEKLALTKDPRTGQIIEARITPTQFYQAIDKIRNSGSAKAQLAAQKAAEAQMAATAHPTSTAPPAASLSADDRRAANLEKALNGNR